MRIPLQKCTTLRDLGHSCTNHAKGKRYSAALSYGVRPSIEAVAKPNVEAVTKPNVEAVAKPSASWPNVEAVEKTY